MKALIFAALALTSSPQPAPNYYAEISPAVSAEIQQLVLDGQYREYLDFNDDGNLNIADVVGVEKRYQDNCTYGNEITLDRETVQAIAEENYIDDLLYWEIYRADGELTRQYELTAAEIMTAEIYLEFETYAEIVTVELNPYTEIITVIS